MSTPDAAAVITLRSGRRANGWLFTILATVVSTYALDAIATAAGVLLVASGALAGVGYQLLLVLLAGTYVAWGAGLRVNLRANFELLEAAGTSSNALSKLAYEVARKRSNTSRVRRFAAGAGYVGSELAKEVPYYAAAFGVALASDTVTSRDALIFLAGTNLGAAVYEYGLGRLTWICLRHPARQEAPAVD